MKYIIDTAEQSEIDKWKEYICGVTTNPSLLKKADISDMYFFEKNKNHTDNIFIQVNDLDYVKTILDSGIDIKKIIFKVPLVITTNFDGFKLLKYLIAMGVRTCATIVYDIHQFNFACDVGSEFSIVLVAKNENVFFMSFCSELKMKKNYKTKIVAASFRTPAQVLDCINDGADYATVPPSVMQQLFSNENVIIDYNKFYGIV